MGFDDSDMAALDRAFGVYQILPVQLYTRELRCEVKLYIAIILDALRSIQYYHSTKQKTQELAKEDYKWLMSNNHSPFAAVTICEELRLDIKKLRVHIAEYIKNKSTAKMPRRSPVTTTSQMSHNYRRSRRKRRRTTSRVTLPSVA